MLPIIYWSDVFCQEIKTDTPDEGKHHMINLMVSLIKNPNSREFLRQQVSCSTIPS